MDFDAAAARLAKDHSNLIKQKRTRQKLVASSTKAKSEGELRKYEKRRLEAGFEKRQLEFVQRYMRSSDHAVGLVTSLQSVGHNNDSDCGLMLQPTSIHGDGDKIALPPSVLAELADRDLMGSSGQSASPLTFRIGILNPDYVFPASDAIKFMMKSAPTTVDDSISMEDIDENIDEDSSRTKAYLDELSCKYLSYTHASVVEFSQEEGYIGLPATVASALLNPNGDLNAKEIPVIKTVDPALISGGNAADSIFASDDANVNEDADSEMNDTQTVNVKDEYIEMTPGHIAWGAFEVPDLNVEVSLVTLPKGKKCALVPTKEAVQNGFHLLKDIKLVLEQSLIRTRATLSVGDTVHSWSRGKKFDLKVTSVSPADFGAVSCMNTDIEVDIGPVEDTMEEKSMSNGVATSQMTTEALMPNFPVFAPGTGHKLIDSAAYTKSSTACFADLPMHLPPEPLAEQRIGVCTIQIRGDGFVGRRRFDTSITKVEHVFLYAASVCGFQDEVFKLVARFPRRVFVLEECGDKTLKEAGIGDGQEMFMVERL